MRAFLRAVLAAVAVAGLAATANAQGLLDRIRAKGVVVIGVKNDYRPYGFLDPSGAIVGFEIDIAAEIAQRLGVRADYVPVIAANRMEFLQQGRIDMIVASMSDTPQRRQVVGFVEPLYYAGGSSILTRKSSGIARWADLRGRRICATQGAYYNRPITERYGANIVAFPSVVEAHNALLSGDCVAFLQDSSLHIGTLASGDARWADFHAPLPTEDEVGWAIGVPLAERDGAFGKAVSAIIAELARSGRLQELEKKWNLPPSPFLVQLRQRLGS